MSFYDLSIGLALDVLDSLSAVLNKGEAHPNSASLPDARIYEDMLPLRAQIFILTDLCIKVAAGLTSQEPSVQQKNLKTFADFQARIEQARVALEKCDKDTVNTRDGEKLTIGLLPGEEAEMTGRTYITGYITPTLYFHLTTVYNIMRNEGVPLGKMAFFDLFFQKKAKQLEYNSCP